MARRKVHKRPISPAAPAGSLWLYGVHAVAAALANPARRRHRLLATRQGLAQVEAALPAASGATAALAVPVEPVERARLEALLPPGAVHQGLALEAEPLPAVSLERVLAGAEGGPEAVIVALDRVSDPQNLGAVLRSAAAFGARAVIVTDRHAPGESGAVAKAASGALERVPLVRAANLARALAQLKEAGFWCVGLDRAARDALGARPLPGRCVLVVGAEGTGLRRLTLESCDFLVRIPIAEAVDSLNMSAAAAIALWELAGRRRAAATSRPTSS